MPQPGASQAVTNQHQDIPQTSDTKDSCKTINAYQIPSCAHCCRDTYQVDGKFAFPQHLLKCNSSSITSVMLPYKNPHSTKLLHHCKHSDCLKAAPFLLLISGEAALVGLVLPYSCIHLGVSEPTALNLFWQHSWFAARGGFSCKGYTAAELQRPRPQARLRGQLWALHATGSTHSPGGRHSSRDSLCNHRSKYARN